MSEQRTPKVISVEDLAEAVTSGSLRALKSELSVDEIKQMAHSGLNVAIRPGIWIGIPVDVFKTIISQKSGDIGASAV